MRLLLCNVSWMKRYEGVGPDDVPRHGGEYVRKNGFGHEAINFKPLGGKVYGFVQLRTGTIDVTRLDENAEGEACGVLVAWRARSSRGSVVVGWYRNATVHRRLQDPLPGRSFQHRGRIIAPKWIIEANASDAFIVPPHHRSFTVPVSHKGFGAQTFVSFLDSDYPEVAHFRKSLLKYITDAESGHYPPANPGKKLHLDQVRKLMIERAAIKAAAEYYAGQGYDVVSVEKENLGYDLEAKLKAETLLIEVKGTDHHVDDATVNLSPNEYRKSKSKRRQYRICIVTSALSHPSVNNFVWDVDDEMWVDEDTNKSLSVMEVVSANMAIR